MVKLHQRSDACIMHRLISNKKLKGWNNGDTKDVLIVKYSDNRFAVMGLWFPNTLNPKESSMDYFYQIFDTEEELHQTFTEQFTNILGFSKG